MGKVETLCKRHRRNFKDISSKIYKEWLILIYLKVISRNTHKGVPNSTIKFWKHFWPKELCQIKSCITDGMENSLKFKLWITISFLSKILKLELIFWISSKARHRGRGFSGIFDNLFGFSNFNQTKLNHCDCLGRKKWKYSITGHFLLNILKW